jgi:hypothetical protein
VNEAIDGQPNRIEILKASVGFEVLVSKRYFEFFILQNRMD